MVTEIFKGVKKPGYHTICFNADYPSAGMYIIKMNTENFTKMKKGVLLNDLFNNIDKHGYI